MPNVLVMITSAPAGDVVFVHRSHDVGVTVDREARPGGFAHGRVPALEFGSSPAVDHNNLITFRAFSCQDTIVFSHVPVPHGCGHMFGVFERRPRHLAAPMLQVRLTIGQLPAGGGIKRPGRGSGAIPLGRSSR